MLELQGKFGTAKVFTDLVDLVHYRRAIRQI